MDQAKLARLQASVRIGGKGTPRRKVKKTHKNSEGDDKKIQSALKKINVQPIQGIEEVNFFREDGRVTHFSNPRVQASVPANTFAIYGNGEDKDIAELVPGIIPQLGAESLNQLRKLAEAYQQSNSEADKKDEDIPDLVEGEAFDKVD